MLSDDISRKLESKLDEKIFSQSRKKQLKDGFKKGKVINEVLDKPTVMTLYKLILIILLHISTVQLVQEKNLLCFGQLMKIM